MLDWNGNGQIDPVDIGISMMMEDAFEEETGSEEAGSDAIGSENARQKKPAGGGCLTACFLGILGIACITIVLL